MTERVAIEAAEFWLEDAEDDEAVVLEWFVSTGGTVEEGDPVCEIQVEKANVDVLAPVSGTVADIAYERDEEFDRNETLAYVESGEE
jgi:pyruvate/2-oxoglutarate dehydrogenase complex dihydrolipoamide acyltransferase (E2) component